MMSEKTKAAYENLREVIGNRAFDTYEIVGVSAETLEKYGLIERTKIEEAEEMSLQEAVDLLNEMEGEDCYYNMSDFYREYRLEDGKIYVVYVTFKYKWTEEF